MHAMTTLWRVMLGGALSVVALAGCLSSPARRCRDATDATELRQLSVTTDSAMLALRRAPESQATPIRQFVQSVVDRAAHLDQCGLFTSVNDLRTATQIGLSAGLLGVETAERAYGWARRAVVADTADRRNWRMMAYAWDQYQLAQQRPQWFATVVSCPDVTPRKCQLAPIDTTHVTDAQRAELGLRTLVQQREMLDSLNRSKPRP
jgi:hypothetical protein